MDTSTFRLHHWLIIGGAAGLLAFGLLDWVRVSAFGFSDTGGNAFDFFWTGTLPWMLITASATFTVLVVQGVIRSDSAPWPLLVLLGTSLGALLLVVRLVFNPIDGSEVIEDAGGSVGRTLWMFLAVASGVTSAVGGYLGFQAEGGTLDDLTDLDRLRQSFTASRDEPPPPPPGS
jgi:hypothetical protein